MEEGVPKMERKAKIEGLKRRRLSDMRMRGRCFTVSGETSNQAISRKSKGPSRKRTKSKKKVNGIPAYLDNGGLDPDLDLDRLASSSEEDKEETSVKSGRRKKISQQRLSMVESQVRLRSVIDKNISEDEDESKPTAGGSGDNDNGSAIPAEDNNDSEQMSSQGSQQNLLHNVSQLVAAGVRQRQKLSRPCNNGRNAASQSQSQVASSRPTYLDEYFRNVKAWKKHLANLAAKSAAKDSTEGDKNQKTTNSGGNQLDSQRDSGIRTGEVITLDDDDDNNNDVIIIDD